MGTAGVVGSSHLSKLTFLRREFHRHPRRNDYNCRIRPGTLVHANACLSWIRHTIAKTDGSKVRVRGTHQAYNN